MSHNHLSVAAGAERGTAAAGRIDRQNPLQPMTSLYDRRAGITVPRRTMQTRAGHRDGIVSIDEPSGSFRDRVEAGRVGAVRAGTSRYASFGFIPFA